MPRKSVDNEKACQAIIPGIIHSPKPSFLFCMVIPQMPENMPIEAHCQRSRGINACSAPLYLIEQCVINRNTIFIYKRHRKNWCQCFKFFRTFSKMVDSPKFIFYQKHGTRRQVKLLKKSHFTRHSQRNEKSNLLFIRAIKTLYSASIHPERRNVFLSRLRQGLVPINS